MHPLQEDCASDNPQEFAAWCWAAGIPDPSPVRPAPIPLIGPMLVNGVSEMLWHFGFRHHPDLQTKWITGTAGVATMADLTDRKPEADSFNEKAKEFLSSTNPKLLEAVLRGTPDERAEMLKQLEGSFAELSSLIAALKEQI